MNTDTIQIDRAGRVALAKWLRDKLGLVPGDKLRISVEGRGFKIEPLGNTDELVRKGGVLVFTGRFSKRITVKKVNELINSTRRHRHTDRVTPT
ncbi:MAG TPA: AbrB/MazE/SpoVT family DNA-binding domain-containing protein [Verrucomicrobiae bacterium]